MLHKNGHILGNWKSCTTKRRRLAFEQQVAGSSTDEYGYSDTETLSALFENDIEHLLSEHCRWPKYMFQCTSICSKGTQTEDLISNYKESPAQCNMHSTTCQASDTQFQLFYVLR